MVIVFDKDAALRQGIVGGGSALAQGLQQRGLQQQQQQQAQQQQQGQRGALNSVLQWMQDLPPGGDMMEHIGTLQQTLQGQNYDPSVIQPIIQELVKQRGVGKQAATQSPFQKRIEEKKADFFAETVFDAPHVANAREGITQLRNLAEGVKGASGYLKAAIGTEQATEFNALGLLGIKNALNVFNPRGAVPLAKIKMVEKKFAPVASDNRWTIEGKIKAQEKFVVEAEKRQEMLNGLLELYGDPENIPMEAILNYEKSSLEFIDKTLEEYGVTDVNKDGIPDKVTMQKPTNDMAQKNKGRIIINQETGEKLISDGNRWVKYKG